MLALYFEPDRGVMPKQAEINMAGLAEVIALLRLAGEIGQPVPDPNASSTCNICRLPVCNRLCDLTTIAFRPAKPYGLFQTLV